MAALFLLCVLLSSLPAVHPLTSYDAYPDLEAVVERIVTHKTQAMRGKLYRTEGKLSQLAATADNLKNCVDSKDQCVAQLREQRVLLLNLQEQLERERNARLEQEKKIEILQQRVESLERGEKQRESVGADQREPARPTHEDPTTAGGKRLDEAFKKRADDFGPLEPVMTHLTQQLNEVTAQVQVLNNAHVFNEQSKGSSYVHWGGTRCGNSSETVYTGYVGGSWYNTAGGPGNHLCLSDDPVFDNHATTRFQPTNVFGAEYETCDETSCELGVTCAVCHVPRSTTVMVPGRNDCWPGWTLEYSGYVMGGNPFYGSGSSEYVCVDGVFGHLAGTQHDDEGHLLYYTIARCGSLPCPPYVEGKIVLCAVCSR